MANVRDGKTGLFLGDILTQFELLVETSKCLTASVTFRL